MNTLLFAILFYFPFFGQDSSVTAVRKHIFGQYTVTTGYNNKVQFMTIAVNKKVFFYSLGGDGQYEDFDTLDINNDGIVDFVYVDMFEDGSELNALISTTDKDKYSVVGIADNILKSPDCSIDPYKFEDMGYRDFVITDFDKDGKKDIMTCVMVEKGGRILSTGCTVTILNQQIPRKNKDNVRSPFIKDPATAPK